MEKPLDRSRIMIRLPTSHPVSWSKKHRLGTATAVLILFALYTLHREKPTPPSVNLVIASTAASEPFWVSKLTVPNLKVINFVADDPSARYHPPANKGREAMIYLTYLYYFYDNLPDISIFVHGEEYAWHNDAILESSTAYTINNLDLDEVQRRKYLNLHIDWRFACPAWINTSNTDLSSVSQDKYEEPYMKTFFTENFPTSAIPEILAQPCCSQFAITKSAIRSVPKSQYLSSINWLLASELPDKMTGRMWEHVWHWLFLGKAVVCPDEYKTLCRGWHICFQNQKQLEEWNEVQRMMDWKHPSLGRTEIPRKEIEELGMKLEELKQKAVERGTSRRERLMIAGNL